MRAHGHGDADSSQDHGDKADEAEKSGGVVKAAGEFRAGLAKIHDLRVGQDLFQFEPERGDVLSFAAVWGTVDLEEIALAGAAAEAKQSAFEHRMAGDHHAWAKSDA